MTNVERYVVTGFNYPEWFKNGSGKGLLRVINDDEGNFLHILVETPTGRKIAKKGDVVVKTKSGYSVLTKEQAEKFKVTFAPKKKEKEVEKKAEVKEDEVGE